MCSAVVDTTVLVTLAAEPISPRFIVCVLWAMNSGRWGVTKVTEGRWSGGSPSWLVHIRTAVRLGPSGSSERPLPAWQSRGWGCGCRRGSRLSPPLPTPERVGKTQAEIRQLLLAEVTSCKSRFGHHLCLVSPCGPAAQIPGMEGEPLPPAPRHVHRRRSRGLVAPVIYRTA